MQLGGQLQQSDRFQMSASCGVCSVVILKQGRFAIDTSFLKIIPCRNEAGEEEDSDELEELEENVGAEKEQEHQEPKLNVAPKSAAPKPVAASLPVPKEAALCSPDGTKS